MFRRFTILFCLLPIYSISQVVDPIYDAFKNSFSKLISDCKIEYTSKCTYPDSSILDIKGIMCMKNNHYYDSSNTRLILYNDKWFLNVDHLEKEVAVLYMPNWKKEFGTMRLFIAEILYSDSIIYKHSKITKEEVIDGKYWVRIKFDKTITTMNSLSILYQVNSLVPLQYEGKVLYPFDFDQTFNNEDNLIEETPTAFVEVDFKCFNIRNHIEDALFDEARFIEYKDKGAYLKQFKKYKMYNPKL